MKNHEKNNVKCMHLSRNIILTSLGIILVAIISILIMNSLKSEEIQLTDDQNNEINSGDNKEIVEEEKEDEPKHSYYYIVNGYQRDYDYKVRVINEQGARVYDSTFDAEEHVSTDIIEYGTEVEVLGDSFEMKVFNTNLSV